MPILKLGIVDDHTLFRKGLIHLIEIACIQSKPSILFEASNGKQMIEKLEGNNLPHIIIMDVNMPVMNGYEAVFWLSQNYPDIKVLVVSMIENEESILNMLRIGIKGYLGKDVEPKELGDALEAIKNKGYYYTDFITGKLIHSLNRPDNNEEELIIHKLNDREKEFLRLACTDLTYTEIAAKMFLSPKTIDGYRAVLFQKLAIKNRVGLALCAVKYRLIVL